MRDRPVKRAYTKREFPETDLTRYKLRTKSAPLSRSGTHEVVAMGVTLKGLTEFARVSYGKGWRKTYEIVHREKQP